MTGKTAHPDKHVTAIHFRGPSWESDQDGPLIEGKAKANSPVPGSIPQLLVETVRNQDTGVFGKEVLCRWRRRPGPTGADVGARSTTRTASAVRAVESRGRTSCAVAGVHGGDQAAE